MSTKWCKSCIGSLTHLVVTTCPDILYSVRRVRQRKREAHKEHLSTAKRILRYLCVPENKPLKYFKSGRQIVGYIDADCDAYLKTFYTA